MPKLHLKQPEFAYSGCGWFTKHRGRIPKFREIGDLKDIYKKELDKACFAHNAVYSDRKDIAKRTISENILEEITYEITANPKNDGYHRGLASMVYKFFDKKTGSGAKKSVNKELKEELGKPVIKNSKDEKSMLDQKIIFKQQITLKWDHYFLKI